MASTIGGGINEDGSLQNTLVIDEADQGKIDVVGLENADTTEIAVNAKLTGLKLGLKGDSSVVIAGKKITDAVITNEAPKGKTAEFVISNKKVKDLEFVTTGKGATDLSVAEGKFVKGSITTSAAKAKDSISFASAATVNASLISTGKGSDTITFKGGLTLKGKTTVESGQGKDVIEVGDKNGKGKLVLSDFSKKDRLVVGDDTFKLADIENGDAPKFIRLDA